MCESCRTEDQVSRKKKIGKVMDIPETFFFERGGTYPERII